MAKISKRTTGLTKDAGYQIGARKTFPVDHKSAWEIVTSPEGRKLWLGASPDLHLEKGAAYRLKNGDSGEVRVCAKNSHLRITWHPKGWPRASLIQVRVIPKENKTVIAFHQEHLPGPDEREARQLHFKSALHALERLIESGKA
ncbi:MAG: SRPBCC domain-containing protein [Planctomycetes bacterium]|nr:SRPBCC domain-containing protein [Planctomycetota bacterium]